MTIRDGYGGNHLSKYARDVAFNAFAPYRRNPMNKVTDLEAFCLSHIVRPYADKLGIIKRPEVLPFSLDEVVTRLSAGGDWPDLVLGRLSELRFWFPSYVQHPIVDLVLGNQSKAMEKPHD